MGNLRDELQSLLNAEDLAAECPPEESPLRRPDPKRLPLAQAMRQCAAGQIVAALDKGAPVAVASLQSGTLVVLADSCPHDGGLLSDGFVEGENIVCARHGWEFDGHTGECLGRPDVIVPCRARKPPHI